ncbi:protein FAM98A-like isoform X2 [Rhinoraja longicauda]
MKRYSGQLLEEGALAQGLEEGASSQHFTAACAWLVSELNQVTLLEERITPTTGAADAETFQLEVSGLLSELHCPYPSLTTGSPTSRLHDTQPCLQLLQFLGSELQAARLLWSRRHALGQHRAPEDAGSNHGDVQARGELQALCQAVGMAEPPPGISTAQLFTNLEDKIRETMAGLPEGAVGRPLLSKSLEPAQWEHLELIQQAMCVEYECRRQMLISRLDVTVQSFHWSERAQHHGAAMAELYKPLRASLCCKTGMTLAHLLSAREDLSDITRTTSRGLREKTTCAINKVLMGPVPDRGGRPGELERPMATWEGRRSGGDQRSGGDRRGGGDRRREKRRGGKGHKH